MLHFDTNGAGKALVDGVARAGEKDDLPRVSQHPEANLQSIMCSRCQKNILKSASSAIILVITNAFVHDSLW